MSNQDNFEPFVPLVSVPNQEWVNACVFKESHFKQCGNAGAYVYSVVENGFSTIVTVKCVACGEMIELKWDEV